ncbi:MAG: hypothetical protein AAFX81_15475 [Pseudomonadota bacterium]
MLRDDRKRRVALLAIAAGPAMAQDRGKCQPMTLMSDDADRSMHHVGVHEEGARRGD